MTTYLLYLIFISTYFQCEAKYDDANPVPRGKKYPLKHKYFYGFLILALIFVCIWGPILLFTDYGVEQMVVPDMPVETKINIRFESYPSLYTQIIHKSQLIP